MLGGFHIQGILRQYVTPRYSCLTDVAKWYPGSRPKEFVGYKHASSTLQSALRNALLGLLKRLTKATEAFWQLAAYGPPISSGKSRVLFHKFVKRLRPTLLLFR